MVLDPRLARKKNSGVQATDVMGTTSAVHYCCHLQWQGLSMEIVLDLWNSHLISDDIPIREVPALAQVPVSHPA